jgi:hypothetical protein
MGARRATVRVIDGSGYTRNHFDPALGAVLCQDTAFHVAHEILARIGSGAVEVYSYPKCVLIGRFEKENPTVNIVGIVPDREAHGRVVFERSEHQLDRLAELLGELGVPGYILTEAEKGALQFVPQPLATRLEWVVSYLQCRPLVRY